MGDIVQFPGNRLAENPGTLEKIKQFFSPDLSMGEAMTYNAPKSSLKFDYSMEGISDAQQQFELCATLLREAWSEFQKGMEILRRTEDSYERF